jgi:hypothetical protein
MSVLFVSHVINTNRDLLDCFDGSSDVKLLTKLGEIKQFLSEAPLLSPGIHVTNNNNIILGAMEKVF